LKRLLTEPDLESKLRQNANEHVEKFRSDTWWLLIFESCESCDLTLSSIANEFVRHALEAFDRAGMLREFWTAISWNPNSPLNRFLSKISRRAFCAPFVCRINQIENAHGSVREAVRLLAGGVGLNRNMKLARSASTPYFASSIEKLPSDCTTSTTVAPFYAYEDGALESFGAARDRGLKRIYDLPIGYWRVGQKIFAEEKEREPEWAPTLTGTLDSAEKLARKMKSCA